jgi:Phosphotransferase enzyme family
VRLPAGPEDVTPEWLTSVLHTDVATAEWQTIGQDFGFTGMVGRVSMTGSVPASLVVKLPMAEGATISGYRAMAQRDVYFQRAALEARFYSEIEDAPVPRLHYAAVDETDERVVVVLEDLTTARQGDDLHGCSVEDAKHVVERITPFHARWRGRAPAGFPRWRDRIEARQAGYDRNLGVFLERFGDRLPAEARAIAERLRPRLAEVVAPLVAREQTLIHGDLHLDNVLFDAPPDGRPVILDWQTPAIGPAILDVVMFVFGSLSVDDRRSAADDLLADYSLDAIRRALLSMFAGVVGGLARPNLDEITGRERALYEATLDDEQYVSALLDYGTSELLAV